MKFYWQNLKREDHSKHLLHGRAWLGDFHMEWAIPSSFWHVRLHLNCYDETAIGLNLALGFFSLYIENNNKWLFKLISKVTKRKGGSYTNGRVIGVAYFDQALWVSLWEDPMEWNNTDPGWWKFNIRFNDLLLGKASYQTETLQQGVASIDMPEGAYDAIYNVVRQTWKRPRWFNSTRMRIWFDIPVGIPHQGKGENSWDCDMDAIFGCGAEWNGKLGEATKKVAMDALKTRQRYGSLNSSEYAKWRRERIRLTPQPKEEK